MEIKKIIVFFMILMCCLFSVNATQCYFKGEETDCKIINANMNEFVLNDLSGQEGFDRYEVDVYTKHNPTNKIKFDLDSLELNQVFPFLDSDVYTFKVRAYNKAGLEYSEVFEYVVDNTDVMPPMLPTKLITQSSININHDCSDGNIFKFELNAQGVQNVQEEEILLNLKDGFNYVKAYCQNNGKVSQTIERTYVVLKDSQLTTKHPSITDISLSDVNSINSNTVNRITTKRNFYIQGKLLGSQDNLEGSVVYVNGQRTIADYNGEFGAFVLLNEGINNIEIKSGDITKEVEVTYVDLKFRFTSVDISKITSSSNLNIQGNVNFDSQVILLVNGVVKQVINTNSQQFNIELPSVLNPGKNFVELRGINNEVYKKIVYYDTQNPTVEFLSLNKIANNKELIFEIKDDIGVDVSSVKLFVNNEELDITRLNINSDFYIFNISDYDFGSYDFRLEVSDLVGNEFNSGFYGGFEITNQQTLINDIVLNGNVYGNKIFINKGENLVSILPSKNIAFKSIYLDDIEQIDYEILKSNEVELKLNIENKNGVLELNFIDNTYKEYSQQYYYYMIEDDKLDLELDYIQKPFGKKILVSGNINNDFFDWSSLLFYVGNSQAQVSYDRFGNYFEAYLDIEQSGKNNLKIVGVDYADNYLDNLFNGILFKDIVSSQIESKEGQYELTDKFKGSIYESDVNNGVYNFVSSYDGLSFNRLFLYSDYFQLPINQREGIKKINLEGFESSGREFRSYNEYEIFQEINYVYANGNYNPEIYLEGVDFNTKEDFGVVQGYFRSSDMLNLDRLKVSHVSDKSEQKILDNSLCSINEFSFSCLFELDEGLNKFKFSIQDQKGREGVIEFNITKFSSLTIDIIDYSGDVYKNNNYLVGRNVKLESLLNNPAIVSVLIDGQEIILGDQKDNFDTQLDLSHTIKSVDKKDVSIQLKAQDELGNVAFSDKLILLYKKVFDTLATVIVE